MWKLIIFVSAIHGLGGNADGGVHVHSIDGFKSPIACQQAITSVREALDKRPMYFRATCVYTG